MGDNAQAAGPSHAPLQSEGTLSGINPLLLDIAKCAIRLSFLPSSAIASPHASVLTLTAEQRS